MSPGSNSLLIYGGYGYTGTLLAKAALARELRRFLCGRDTTKLRAAAEELYLEYRVAGLDDARALGEMLRGVRAVGERGGSVQRDLAADVDACLRAGTHYLDVSGEVGSLDFVSRRHAEARARGIISCRASASTSSPPTAWPATLDRVRRPRRLSIGITGLRTASRGLAQSTIDRLASRSTSAAAGSWSRSRRVAGAGVRLRGRTQRQPGGELGGRRLRLLARASPTSTSSSKRRRPCAPRWSPAGISAGGWARRSRSAG